MLHDFKPSDDGLDKARRKAEINRLREKLAAQQQSVMAAKLPVIVLVEGWDCAGKGHLINELISEMETKSGTSKTTNTAPVVSAPVSQQDNTPEDEESEE